MPQRKQLKNGARVVYARPRDPRPDAKPLRPLIGDPFPDTDAGWAAAKAAEKAWIAQRRPDAQWSVDRLLDEWLAWGATRGQFGGCWQVSTSRINHERAKAFRKLHGRRPAEEISRDDAKDYVRAHSRSHRSSLRAAFEWGRLAGKVFTNVWDATRGGRGTRGRQGEIVITGRNALTEDDAARLAMIATDLHGAWHGAMIRFVAYTGLRQGEAYAAQPHWLRLDAGRLDVLRQYRSNEKLEADRWALPKGEKARYDIVLLDEARAALADLDGDTPYLFTPPRQAPGDKPHFDRRTHFHYWNAARLAFQAQLPAGHWLRERIELARAGEEDAPLTFHELRHTFATILLETPGVSRDQVALQLGDTVKEIERTYGHARTEAASAHITRARSAQREGRLADLDAARARRATNWPPTSAGKALHTGRSPATAPIPRPRRRSRAGCGPAVRSRSSARAGSRARRAGRASSAGPSAAATPAVRGRGAPDRNVLGGYVGSAGNVVVARLGPPPRLVTRATGVYVPPRREGIG